MRMNSISAPSAAPVKPETDLSRIDLAVIRRQLNAMLPELKSNPAGRAHLRRLQVEAALRKLDRGAYGRCDACARPVIKTRLLATPFVRYCALCCE